MQYNPHLRSARKANGFTLVELAVVLVIIGLIAGSLMVGQELIRSSRLHGVASEYDQYLRGIKQFQDKYQALPGDMSTASSQWTGVANGDGDGRIGSITDTATGATARDFEWTYAWQHLASAKLIEGHYTGNSCISLSSCIPASRLSGAGWQILYYLQTADSPTLWGDQYGHIFRFGNSASGSNTLTPALTPHEAYDLDAKLDDGHPGTGTVRAYLSAIAPVDPTTNCTATNTSAALSTYNEANVNISCGLIFITGF